MPSEQTVEMAAPSVNVHLGRSRWTDRRVWTALTVLYLGMWVSLFQVYDGGQFIDPFNHITYLTSLLHDRDLDFANDIVAANTFDRQRLLQLGQIAPNGMIKNNWPPGAALLWAPFVVPTHLVTNVLLPRFGIPAPERFAFPPMLAVSLATSVWGYVALWLLYRLGRLWHRPGSAGAAAAVVLACSPLGFHLFRCAASDHGLATLTVAWWLLLALRPWGAHPCRRALWLGLAAGMMVLVRWQDVVFGLAGVAALAPRWLRLLRRSPKDAWCGVGLAALGFFAVFGVQMIIWKITYTTWIASPHGAGYLHWKRPLFAALLFSGKGGMLYWHPAMALGFVGLVAAALRKRAFGVGLWIAVLLHLHICAAVDDWHGEWGIGNRRLCALLPLLALGMVEVFSAVRSRVVAISLAALLTLLALGNWIFFLFGYRGSVGLFSPLNQSGWASLFEFRDVIFSNIAAHPLVALIDNTFFTPWLDLGRESGLITVGFVAMLLPPSLLFAARRLVRSRTLRSHVPTALTVALFAIQLFLLVGLQPPQPRISQFGDFASTLTQSEIKSTTEIRSKLEAVFGQSPWEPELTHRASGLMSRAGTRFADIRAQRLELRLYLGQFGRGNPLDKMMLQHRLVSIPVRQHTGGEQPINVGDRGELEAYWRCAWDTLLMKSLFERLLRENDVDALNTFFDVTTRTPVLWWNCQWRLAFETDDADSALEALEHLRVHGPLDVQTLDLEVRTLRRFADRIPNAFERAAETERLADRITEWELTRLHAARESPLYERSFIEDRINFYQSR
jgi:hypothetical protein